MENIFSMQNEVPNFLYLLKQFNTPRAYVVIIRNTTVMKIHWWVSVFMNKIMLTFPFNGFGFCQTNSKMCFVSQVDYI
jgi:hypothetical protein